MTISLWLCASSIVVKRALPSYLTNHMFVGIEAALPRFNNLCEESNRPTQKREKIRGRFKSPRQTQRFLIAHEQINLLFRQTDIASQPNHTATSEMMPSLFGTIILLNCERNLRSISITIWIVR